MLPRSCGHAAPRGKAWLPRRQLWAALAAPRCILSLHFSQCHCYLTTSQHNNSCPSRNYHQFTPVAQHREGGGCLTCSYGPFGMDFSGNSSIHPIRAVAVLSSCRRQAPLRVFPTPAHTQSWLWQRLQPHMGLNARGNEAQDCPLLLSGLWIAGRSNTGGIDTKHHSLKENCISGGWCCERRAF